MYSYWRLSGQPELNSSRLADAFCKGPQIEKNHDCPLGLKFSSEMEEFK